MGGMKVENVTSRVVMLGDNHFQSAKITLAAGATLTAGTVLKRGGDAVAFLPAATTDDYAAVNPFEIKNDSGASKTFGFRALLDGRVRADMLTVNVVTTVDEVTTVTPTPVSVTDIDKLRKIGILPVKVTDLSHLDNQ